MIYLFNFLQAKIKYVQLENLVYVLFLKFKHLNYLPTGEGKNNDIFN